MKIIPLQIDLHRGIGIRVEGTNRIVNLPLPNKVILTQEVADHFQNVRLLADLGEDIRNRTVFCDSTSRDFSLRNCGYKN